MTYLEYDTAKYRVWALPHPLVLHWVLNPGIAFNELILGQRIPRVMLIETSGDQPLVDRTFIPCPHCGTLHPGMLWAKGNAFGHWLGYVCPVCEQAIPCLWNWLSIVLLAVLSPLWILPVWLMKDRWFAYELRRVRSASRSRPVVSPPIHWIRNGVIFFGGAMWLVMAVAPALWLRFKGQEPRWEMVLIQLPIWLAAGLAWGLIMRWFMNKRGLAASEAAAGGASQAP